MRHDGTVALVADIDNSDEWGSDPKYFTPYREGLLFSAWRIDVGYELFKLDGWGHVSLAADINPAGGSDPAGFDRVRAFSINFFSAGPFQLHRGGLYLTANGGPDIGRELYRYGPGGETAAVTAGSLD